MIWHYGLHQHQRGSKIVLNTHIHMNRVWSYIISLETDAPEQGFTCFKDEILAVGECIRCQNVELSFRQDLAGRLASVSGLKLASSTMSDYVPSDDAISILSRGHWAWV